ncbi:hypothetical protein [Bradyrhizobium sp. LHD-71]|uniref:hypothetical protein n=1 Tax=Bradyrhizobium sp. LHD-71 TaxID=3072141 RepID=UPI00280FADCB|nr:hypothetical protein [Bradyrhizobium sp. LHD-71]MDQ8732701.1 hypothetical protein [Bradyrhizobium sp. LHD-71]
MALLPTDSKYLRLLKFSPFERSSRGGWRFGTRPIADGVVDRLIASGRAATDGKLVWLVEMESPEMTTSSDPRLTQTERDIMRTIVFSGTALLLDFAETERELIGALQARGFVTVKPQSDFLVVTEVGRAAMAETNAC